MLDSQRPIDDAGHLAIGHLQLEGVPDAEWQLGVRGPVGDTGAGSVGELPEGDVAVFRVVRRLKTSPAS